MEKNVIHGPPGLSLPDVSFGQFVLRKLQTSPLRIIQVYPKTGEILTNHQLLERSVRLASALEEWKLNSGDTVAISSESQSNWFVAACATMYLGVCVAPLNPAYTEGELRHSLSISRPRLIFASSSTADLIHRVALTLPWRIELIQLDGEPTLDIVTVGGIISPRKQWPDPYRYRAQVVTETSQREVVILSSSGTTGLPKAVMLSHRNLMAAIHVINVPEFLGFDSGTVMLLFLPFFHGYGFATMLSLICNNATAVVMTSFDPEEFCASIERYRVNTVTVVPPIMLFLAKHPIVSNYDFSSLREVICGAAALSREVFEAVQNRLGRHIPIRNGYGMTELSIVTNISPRFTSKIETVGGLMPGISCKVCDPVTSRTLGVNETGELCFKGVHNMLGYKNNPQATAETIDTDGWLHTGDLGYYDDDGHLFIVGRLKELIKYKGFQIAPAEIENLLLSHGDVDDVAVIGKPDERCGEIPVAFVVRKAGSKVTAEELCKFANDQLSIQKHLRGGVRFINAIPKNQTGKILRRELEKLVSKL